MALASPVSRLSCDDWVIFFMLNSSLIDSEMRDSAILKYKHPLKHCIHSVALSLSGEFTNLLSGFVLAKTTSVKS